MPVQTLPVTEARAKLPQLVKAADERFDRTVITSNGKPTAVIMSYEEYEAWEETLEVLSDPEALRAIRQADEELAAGKAVSFEAVFGHKRPKVKKVK
jgi:antitoxin YefM